MKSTGWARIGARQYAANVLAAILGAACMAATSGATAATSPEVEALQATWREAISQTPTPQAGCFTAHYPSMTWSKAACVAAPNIPFIPRTGHNVGARTVGNGNDFTILPATLISRGMGSFPLVTGLRSESDGGANIYSLQLNSQFFNGLACAGAQNPSACLSWLQYVYSSSSQAVFMQYWLINWNTTCPLGWNDYQGSCYTNSAAVAAPQEVITDLHNMKLTGSAVNGRLDTAIFADGANAYTTTGSDNVLYLASNWTGAEFNVLGDGGGSTANFNVGTHLTVKIAVKDGSTAAPQCQSGNGTTGETNNLTLRTCKGIAGVTPAISFGETN